MAILRPFREHAVRALVVEDEERLADIVSRGLKAEGFAVDSAHDGAAGLEFASTYDYDIILLDIQLPKLDGTQLLQCIRMKNRQVPVLILTARDSLQDKVRHFEAGADDYLTKPFAFAELTVRVRALMRRAASPSADILTIADLEINRRSHGVTRAGRRVDLSPKEFALLEYLAVHEGNVLSRAMIIEHVWDQSFEGLTNIVDVYIKQLRSKVDEGFERKLIHTARGFGYRMGAEP